MSYLLALRQSYQIARKSLVCFEEKTAKGKDTIAFISYGDIIAMVRNTKKESVAFVK